MSKILVTGGAGFIGAHVVVDLVNRGDEVIIIDDFNDRYDPALKEARIKQLFENLDQSKITLIREDIADQSAVESAFSNHQPDSVIHLAAWAAVQTSIERPHIYAKANIDGTINILEAARQNNIKNIVFASSSSVYGGRLDMPLNETDDISRPISPYAATKAAGEMLCSTWHHLYGIPITCLRFFTVYGPWGRPEMALFKFSNWIMDEQPIEMRGAKTQRDFTYIDDCVQGVIAAHDNPMGFEIFNLGESDAVPLPRLINALESALGKTATIKEVPLPQGDVPMTLANITKAQEKLDYNPTTKIEEGVQKFVTWYRDWYRPSMLSQQN